MVVSGNGYLYSRSDIAGIFEHLVKKYMMKYRMSVWTLEGGQGEVAKMDFADGKDVIRIWLADKVERFKEYSDDDWWSEQGLSILVERFKDVSSRSDIWYGKGEMVEVMSFYDIGKGMYASWDEADRIEKVRRERFRAKLVRRDYASDDDRLRKIALKYVQRQNRCKGKKIEDILTVEKRYRDWSFRGEKKSEWYYRINLAGGKGFVLEVKR